MANDFVNIVVTKEEIRAQFEQLFKQGSPHLPLITNVILDNLCTTEVGLRQLYKAFSGIKEIPKYSVGDNIWVAQDNLYVWQFDKEKMEEKGLIFQGNVPATIKEVDMTRSQPYQISYIYIDKTSGKEEKQNSVRLEENKIIPKDKYPLSL